MELNAENKDSATNSNASGVGRNLMWMVWSGAVSIANSMVLWAFIARFRDVEELGRFTIVMGLYALFYNVCSLGLIPYFVSEISRRKAHTISEQPHAGSKTDYATFISSAATFLSITSIVCAILMTIGGVLVSESSDVRLSTLILSLALLPTAIISIAEATAISLGRTRLIASISTLENILRTVSPFVLIFSGFGISVICVSFVAVRLVAMCAYLWVTRYKLRKFSFSLIDFVKIAKVSPVFGITIALSAINWQVVIIFLAYFSTESESAKYGVASRFLIPVAILMASYANVFQPVFTQHIQRSTTAAGAYLSKMLSYPLILSVLAAVISPFLSSHVLTVLFGDKYSNAAATLDVLALSVIPFCVVMIVARGLISVEMQRVDLLANVAGVIVCITASLILIPQYGAIGAAVAQLLSFFSMAILEVVYLSRKIIGFRAMQKTCLSSLSMLVIYLIIWKF